MGAVSNQGRTLLAKGGDNQLANLSVWQNLPRLRINNLKIHIVVPVMHSALIVTAHGDSRSVNLRQPINVIKLYPQFRRDSFAHLLAPPF